MASTSAGPRCCAFQIGGKGEGGWKLFLVSEMTNHHQPTLRQEPPRPAGSARALPAGGRGGQAARRYSRPEHRLIVLFGLEAGLRRSEILNLRVHHLHWSAPLRVDSLGDLS